MKNISLLTKQMRASVICGALSLMLVSCEYSLALWILPGSSLQNLTFGISERRDGQEKVQVTELNVYPCSTIQNRGSEGYYPPREQTTWSVVSKTADPKPATNRIIYGQSPPGLLVVQNPQPLNLSNCYVVLAYAIDTRGNTRSSTIGFRIDTSGNVLEMSESEYRKLF